jgi:hypothetical protein
MKKLDHRVKEKNMFEVYEITDKEYVKHKKERSRYTAYVGEFLFWVQSGIKPSSISFEEYLLYQPLCENLVKNGRLKQEILESFKQA